MTRPALDDVDLDIIAALHVAPRVPTAALASVLGLPASTVRRRLAIMQEARVLRVVGRYAWELITSSNPFELWITSRAGKSEDVIAALLKIPDIQLVMQVSGPADVYANLFPLHGSDRDHLLGSLIPAIPGVRSIDSRMILEPLKVGQSWRFDRLLAKQQDVLRKHVITVDQPTPTSLESLSSLEFAVMRALGVDGRASASEIARTLDVSASTAARVIRTLIQNGSVTPRVEITPQLLGFPYFAFLSLDVEPRHVEPVLNALVDHGSVRVLSTVTGVDPISVTGVFASPEEIARFVRHGVGALEGVRSVSSVVGLKLFRRYWIDVDEDGERLGEPQIASLLTR